MAERLFAIAQAVNATLKHFAGEFGIEALVAHALQEEVQYCVWGRGWPAPVVNERKPLPSNSAATSVFCLQASPKRAPLW